METSQPARVLNSALRNTASTPTKSTTNPPFVSKYVKTRHKIEELELERRELESEVIEWGVAQIRDGSTHNQTLPIRGALGKKVELSIVNKKATEKQLLSSYTELRQLAEYLEDDRVTAIQRNARKIGQLKVAIAEMQEEIESLSYSDDGKVALADYQSMLRKLSSITPPTLGLRMKNI